MFRDTWKTNSSKTHNISPLPSNEDIHHLISTSGQFIHASAVIEFINDDDRNPGEQLDIILKLCTVNSSLPYGAFPLADIGITTYHRLLHDFFQDKKRVG